MSDSYQRSSRARGQALFDPEAFACWRDVDAVPSRLRGVRVLTAATAPVDGRVDGHVHDGPTVVCCLTGTTRIESASGVLDLAAGEAVLVAPGAWHRHATLRAGSSVYAHGLIGCRSDVLLATARRRWWLILAEEPSRGLLERAMQAANADSRRSAVAALIGHFAREPAAALHMTPEQAAMARFVWRNFWRPVTAGDVLRASGLQRAQAHALFRACYGDSPKRALTRSRISLARQLEAEGLDAVQVALRSGFITPARMARARKGFHD
ncbi:MAG: helix-turn-helix transcriptional regulator [Planctomycetes bacterium]|nr:helix-turn-helix transcriptional regulator [Planctomycetota bacterium]